ncbi:MAG: sugar phosphate isomerase/epimerase [Rhodobacteraceae bacterium]|nr:sugar phosphate isomerase/epimerase [Paracoccaceae bacterium]
MRDFSYQLYSSRNFGPLTETLRMISDLGYAQAEGFGGLYGDDAAVNELVSALDATGLSMPTGHFSFDLVSQTPDKAIEIAKRLGLQAVFVPAIAAEERDKDAAGWADFGRALADAGKPLQDAGLAFGWHNHAFEFVDLGGEDLPLDLIMQGGDDLVLELDVAWVQVGGQDPIAWVTKYADRIISAHVKDIAPEGQNADEDGWADVGHGVMDWPAIIGALDESAAKYLIMEHDNPSDDRRFAERSLATARTF